MTNVGMEQRDDLADWAAHNSSGPRALGRSVMAWVGRRRLPSSSAAVRQLAASAECDGVNEQMTNVPPAHRHVHDAESSKYTLSLALRAAARPIAQRPRSMLPSLNKQSRSPIDPAEVAIDRPTERNIFDARRRIATAIAAFAPMATASTNCVVTFRRADARRFGPAYRSHDHSLLRGHRALRSTTLERCQSGRMGSTANRVRV